MANLRTISVYNVTLTNANTEYSQELPPNARALAVQPRTAVDVRMAFVTGKVATPTAPYFTMKTGNAFSLQELQADSTTVYLASATAGTVVEIIVGSW